MKVFITGGAGFMGSNMIRHLLSSDPKIQVVNFDKLTYAGNLANLEGCDRNSRYCFIRGDIADESAIHSALDQHQPDLILNYAAETHVDRSILDPKSFLLTDVVGTYHLLEAVRLLHIPRMVQISTDEVFGSTEQGEFSEQSPFEPNSPYSASKAGGDLLCRAYAVTYQTPVIVTHSCNFYGPYQYPEKVIPLFITNLIEGKKVPLYGDGKHVREWIFTGDHCRAIDTVMRRGRPGEIYNIGTGHRISNLELTKSLLTLLEKDSAHIEYVKDRPGHDRRYAINATKLNREFGWSPVTPFHEGLAKTVQWYQQNSDWWRPLKSGEYLRYYQRQYTDR